MFVCLLNELKKIYTTNNSGIDPRIPKPLAYIDITKHSFTTVITLRIELRLLDLDRYSHPTQF